MYPDAYAGIANDQGVDVVRLSRRGFPIIRLAANRAKFARALRSLHESHPIDIVKGGEMEFSILTSSLPGKKVLRMHGGPTFFDAGIRIQAWKERWAFHVAEHLCAVSHCVAKETRRLLNLGDRRIEVIPNPNLRPETGWSVELGHTTPVLGAVRLDAALFWTEARDLIEPTLVVDTTPKIQLQNVTRARIAGVDATLLSAPIPDHLTASLSYTYLDTRPVLAFRPRHLLTLSADYAPAGTSGAWGLGADFRFASRPERIELEGFVDPRRVAVRVLDLRASWTSGPFDVRVLVANALNYIYNLVPETLAPVRTISVTAAWSY